MSGRYLEPTTALPSRADVFLAYLDLYRAELTTTLARLSESELRSSRLPSGWTPLELIKHLTYVELRWLEWGFLGADIGNPWEDERDGRWFVDADESLAELTTALDEQAARSRAVIEAHDLSDLGHPGPRWEGAEPATLERILFHLVQEYARHVGHLDIVAEIATGAI